MSCILPKVFKLRKFHLIIDHERSKLYHSRIAHSVLISGLTIFDRKRIRADIASQSPMFTASILSELIPQKSDVQQARVLLHNGEPAFIILNGKQPVFFEFARIFYPTGSKLSCHTLVFNSGRHIWFRSIHFPMRRPPIILYDNFYSLHFVELPGSDQSFLHMAASDLKTLRRSRLVSCSISRFKVAPSLVGR